MSGALLYAIAGVLLFAAGAAGVVLLDHLLRRVLAFNIMGSGACLVLVGLAQRNGIPDPVPQAMVLTGIVVAVAATGLALALIRRLHAQTGHADGKTEEERVKGETGAGCSLPASHSVAGRGDD
ncbi:MAG: NADH-quinone oxidoreductase subunit K [Candidatus Accumulibacter sp.]|uniref:NADH-quinone oxidoreductase subunit K n=1 Tax=Accumulibacter sp. TaxID=2053492 RepID=UPI002879D260|nr:NADH-quinone oxidoreductase subunit K [Accumulibacter sp.]MDS4013585.1 NADH-quinone oxidoreductase subunit K [Accumulibacter sp.]